MATHTGDKNLYSCSFCPKTFRVNSNMYAHRKKNHPMEYAKMQNELLQTGTTSVNVKSADDNG